MKKLLLSLAIAAGAIQAQAQYLHDYQSLITAPKGATQDNRTLTKTSDGGYFLITRINIVNNQSTMMCYKLKADMSVDWYRPLIFPTSNGGLMEILDVKQTSDKGYIACGRVINEGVTGGGYLMRLDPGANLSWVRNYPETIVLNSVVETGKGGFMAVSGGSYWASTAAILCTDGSGTPVWSKLVSGTKTMYTPTNYGATHLEEVIRMTDGEYAVVGTTNEFANTAAVMDADAVVLTFKEDGTLMGNWTYGNHYTGQKYTQPEFGFALRFDPEKKTLFLLGEAESGLSTTCDNMPYRDAWVWNIDAYSGAINWSNRYNIMGNKEYDATLYPGVTSMDIGDKQVGIGGSSRDLSTNNYHHDGFLMRLDYGGNMFDYRLYPDKEDQLIFKTMRTKDNSFAMGGYSNTLNPGMPDVWLLESYDVIKEKCRMERPDRPQQKFDVDIIKSVVKDVKIKVEDMKLKDYDYPYEEVALCERIKLDGWKPTARLAAKADASLDGQLIGGRSWQITAGDGSLKVTIVNSLGQQVISRSGLQVSNVVELSDLPAGIYIVRMDSQSETAVRKIMLR
jgi:hypothetical protein